MVTDGNVKNLFLETNKLRIGFLQLLCLENIYKEEADKKKKVITRDKEKSISDDKIEFFSKKMAQIKLYRSIC